MGYIPMKTQFGDAMSSYQEVHVWLVDALGRTRSPFRIAGYTVDAWHRAAAVLEPLLGAGPVAFLYEQSLTEARARFPWLPVCGGCEREPPRMNTGELWKALAVQSPDAALAAASLTLCTFSQLLERSVGEQLASRMLWSAFAASPRRYGFGRPLPA
jgi:hypothetical protein